MLPVKSNNRIVEIAVVLFNYRGEIHERFSTLVDPQRIIPLDAMYVHGISDNAVAGQPRAEQVIPKVESLLKRADMITGFKTWFDLRYLVHECLINGLAPPDFTVYDASRIAYRAGFGQVALVECAEYLGIPVSRAHRALVDSELTSKVWLKFLEQAFDPSDDLSKICIMHDMTSPAYNTERALKSVKESYLNADIRIAEYCLRAEKRMRMEKKKQVEKNLHPICITGSLPGFARKHFKARLEAIDYLYVKEPRKHVELMVIGEKPTIWKVEEANNLGLTTMNGERFVKWLEAKEKGIADVGTPERLKTELLLLPGFDHLKDG